MSIRIPRWVERIHVRDLLTRIRVPRWVTRMSVIVAVMVAALTATLVRVQTTYSVVATTGGLVVTTHAGLPTSWELEDVILTQGFSGPDVVVSGVVEIAPNVEIWIERIAFGPLLIGFHTINPDDSSVGAFFHADGSVVALDSRVVLRIDDFEQRANDGQNIVLPIVGEILLGQGSGVTGGVGRAGLRSATITMIGASPWRQVSYDAGTVELVSGDEFQVEQPTSTAFGMVTVDERPALQVVYQVNGKRGTVARFGAQGYEVSTSMRAKVLNDPVVQGLWATLLTFLLLRGWERRSREGIFS